MHPHKYECQYCGLEYLSDQVRRRKDGYFKNLMVCEHCYNEPQRDIPRKPKPPRVIRNASPARAGTDITPQVPWEGEYVMWDDFSEETRLWSDT